MLEDVIKTRKVCDKEVSILLYSIDKADCTDDGNRNHYYEIRVSDLEDENNWYEDSCFYTKRDTLRTFNIVCKEIEIENGERILKEYGDKLKAEEEERTKCDYDFDVWIYPEDLGIPRVLNIFRDEGEMQTNEYELPEDWEERCVKNGNSIHDIMEIME